MQIFHLGSTSGICSQKMETCTDMKVHMYTTTHFNLPNIYHLIPDELKGVKS